MGKNNSLKFRAQRPTTQLVNQLILSKCKFAKLLKLMAFLENDAFGNSSAIGFMYKGMNQEELKKFYAAQKEQMAAGKVGIVQFNLCNGPMGGHIAK